MSPSSSNFSGVHFEVGERQCVGYRGLGAPAMVSALSRLIFGRIAVGGSEFVGFGSRVPAYEKSY